MPAAVPIAMTAASVIASKISEKKAKSAATAQQPIMMGGEGGGGGGGGGSNSSHTSTTNSWNSGSPISFSGFQDFSKTGGFSASDLSNIRARAISPVRSVYANAQQNVNRQKSLQGGYSPGFGVLQARMAREQGQGISDASINAESDIARMVQQGKLSGLQGMAGTEAQTSGSTTSGSSSSSGGGGGSGSGSEPGMQSALVPEPKTSFWGSLGSGLGKVGQAYLGNMAGSYLGGMQAPMNAKFAKWGQQAGQSLTGGKG